MTIVDYYELLWTTLNSSESIMEYRWIFWTILDYLWLHRIIFDYCALTTMSVSFLLMVYWGSTINCWEYSQWDCWVIFSVKSIVKIVKFHPVDISILLTWNLAESRETPFDYNFFVWYLALLSFVCQLCSALLCLHTYYVRVNGVWQLCTFYSFGQETYN